MELARDYFRRLYEGLYDHHDDSAGRRRYLTTRQPTAADHLAELAPLRTREPVPAGGYTGDDEQLWRMMKLYALSRVNDYLIELFCPARVEFLSGIGLTSFEHADAFSPFHHEIVAVVADPGATQVTVEEVLWPGFWFGDLLFSRAGVRVRSPRHLVDATVATTSTLYFTYRRGWRRVDDPSHGWGTNSQWRTAFPRFYSDAAGLHLNWDGEVDLGDDPPVPTAHDEYPLAERRELLLHRCFVRGVLPRGEADRYPYGDRLSLVSSGWPLRPDSVVCVRR